MRNDQGTFFEVFVRTLQEASIDKKHDQVPPAALLWPDKDPQWEPLLPRLRTCLPLFTLGTYNTQERTGPVYWLRCVVAGTLPEHVLPPGQIPMLYLPGLATRDLRAIAELPKLVQPLAELQYRGVLWRQKRSGRDWTVRAFFQDTLAIEVCKDTETKVALRSALAYLADEPLARLRQAAPLGATFFEALLHSDRTWMP